MTDNLPPSVAPKRNLGLRALQMILMACAFQLAASLLGLVAVVQFVLTLLSDAPNERLSAFGQNLGRYLRQIADFGSFATEDVPFPFSDWPASA
jgi:hypothetical protein